MAQLVAHLVRDQEVAGSSPVIQTQQAWRPFRRHAFLNSTGEVSEWLKEPASKTGVRVTVPGVRIPHSPQSGMASQRSCGAFLLYGRCKLACIRQDSKKAPAGRRPGMPFQVARAPRRASRECTGPPARAQSRQGMHRAPGPSTIPRIPLPSLLQCTQHIFSRLRKLTPIKTKGINLRNRLTSKCVRCSRRKKMLGKCPRPIVNSQGNQVQGNQLLATAMQGSFNPVRLFGEKTSNGPFRGWMTG